MKFQMKALALAVLGLAGFGVAGSAMATCGNATPFAAWSSWTGSANAGAGLGGVTVAGNGLHNTSCAMAASMGDVTGNALGQTATVYDQSPNHEQSYRFRFYIDPTLLKAVAANFNTTEETAVFGANSQYKHSPNTFAKNNNLVRMYVHGKGDGHVYLTTFAACSAGDNKLANRCSNADLDLGTSFGTDPNAGIRIEGQLLIGSGGSLGKGVVNIWTGTNDPAGAPQSVINVDNTLWGTAGTPTDGVKVATLGLFEATSSYMQKLGNKAVRFDEFDSRRQTPIGN